MNKLFVMILTMCMVGCEALQEIDVNPTNTSGKVVDSVREQIEQAREITNATDSVSGSLTDIDAEAEAILNEIALVPTDRNYNIDPTLYSIESSAQPNFERNRNGYLFHNCMKRLHSGECYIIVQ